MLDRLKAKIWCSISMFNVRKNDVNMMSNLVNLNSESPIKFDVHCSKPKIVCSSSSSFDVQKMMFEFVRCSVKMCLYHKELI